MNILLSRQWRLSDAPIEILDLQEGFFGGSREMWGTPAEIGTWGMRIGTTGELHSVVAVWRGRHEMLILRAPTEETVLEAIRESHHGAPLEFSVSLCDSRTGEEYLRELAVQTSGALAEKYTGIFSRADAQRGAVLHAQ